jgi:hypothetical protein
LRGKERGKEGGFAAFFSLRPLDNWLSSWAEAQPVPMHRESEGSRESKRLLDRESLTSSIFSWLRHWDTLIDYGTPKCLFWVCWKSLILFNFKYIEWYLYTLIQRTSI